MDLMTVMCRARGYIEWRGQGMEWRADLLSVRAPEVCGPIIRTMKPAFKESGQGTPGKEQK